MTRFSEKNQHIATSPNGWTDNELGLEYLKTHFEPQTQETQSELGYRILIVDGHASHVTIEVMRFCVQHKIILLCLPPHSTHFLQPLDVGVFGPLGTYYRNIIYKKSAFTSACTISKIDFLEIWHAARKKGMTPKIIKLAQVKSSYRYNIPKALHSVGDSPSRK